MYRRVYGELFRSEATARASLLTELDSLQAEIEQYVVDRVGLESPMSLRPRKPGQEGATGLTAAVAVAFSLVGMLSPCWGCGEAPSSSSSSSSSSSAAGGIPHDGGIPDAGPASDAGGGPDH